MGKSYHELYKWIDSVLEKELPKEIIAFNFNLYEGDNSFHVQLVGCDRFDENDEDWACYEFFSTDENIAFLSMDEAGVSWEEGLSYSRKLLSNYLSVGKQASRLKEKKAVAVGFVDGNLEILFEQ